MHKNMLRMEELMLGKEMCKKKKRKKGRKMLRVLPLKSVCGASEMQ